MLVSQIDAPSSGSVSTQQQSRLAKAADEFEAQMMKELLKPLTAASDDDADGSGGALSSSTESLQGFAAETLGSALARQGGFGIASSIVRQLGAASTPAVPSAATEAKH